ncbi:MAG: hypothetical protein GF355_07105 [Candidatus Eisenbacteria bacterium]|nr:hypothetical protein [Candidatus Eisenbacteria bacterium]
MTNLAVTKVGTLWWIQVHGHLSRGDLRQLALLIGRLGTQPAAKVLADVSRVQHIDFRGVHALLPAVRLVRLRGGDVQLIGATSYVWNLIRLGIAQDADELIQPQRRAARRSARRPSSVFGAPPRSCPTMVRQGVGFGFESPSPN